MHMKVLRLFKHFKIGLQTEMFYPKIYFSLLSEDIASKPANEKRADSFLETGYFWKELLS